MLGKRRILACADMLFRKIKLFSKAYIPLQREIPHVGGSCWAIPSKHDFCVANTSMWVSEKPCGPTANSCRPNANPCGHTASPTQAQREQVEYSLRWVHKGLVHIWHVDFMFVSFSFALGSQCKLISGGIWALETYFWKH